MLGAGGGGDIVGALAIARMCEDLGTGWVLGGVAWERMPIDPHPGPRPVEQIEGGRRLGEHAVLAGASTSTPTGVRFSEALMAEHLGIDTVLVDVSAGASGVADALDTVCEALGCDLVVCADVGGDMLATGDEPGLASPLCDAVMAAGATAARTRSLLAVIGAGCDGELTPAEVLDRVAAAARAGCWTGAWSPGAKVAGEVEAAASRSYTEASLQLVRCARGETGTVPIRDGRRTVELTPTGALAFFLDPGERLAEVAPLAATVSAAPTIEAAREALAARGVGSELEYERSRAAEAGPDPTHG